MALPLSTAKMFKTSSKKGKKKKGNRQPKKTK